MSTSAYSSRGVIYVPRANPMLLIQVLCFLYEAYASYTILMYMSSYEYEICRPFSVPDNIILRPSKSPTMTWRLLFCFAIVVAK